MAEEAPKQALDPAAWLDALPEADARAALLRCCGAARWVDGMLARRPFRSADALRHTATEVWRVLSRDDYLEAFAEHPAIGGDLAALEARFAATKAWSRDEQSGVDSADQATLRALAAGNRAYRERFGYTFIVCATGKTAREMLHELVDRLEHDAESELVIAAQEQEKIMLVRLAKLVHHPQAPERRSTA